MSENHHNDTWFSLGLAFVGGYCDAAGYVLAKTFTGHITGALVLAAIDLAARDWQPFLRNILAITLFLAGGGLILISEQFIGSTPSRFLLSIVMAVELVLISGAYFALSSELTVKVGLFVCCLSLALGLQNGAFTKAGGISVHTTYLTGLITDLFETEAEKQNRKTAAASTPSSGQKAKLLAEIWLAFVVGATVGAAIVLWIGARGLAGAALPLLAMVIVQTVPGRAEAKP